VDHATVGKVADATKAVAETGGKIIDAGISLGRLVKGPVDRVVGMLNDQLDFIRARAQLRLEDKAEAVMRERGLSLPTRELPFNFAFPLLAAAIPEEDEVLQETWARLLVNAGDASTEMELRTAYIEILKGMSAYDVKNLSEMARATLAAPPGTHRAIATGFLPKSAKPFPGHFSNEPEVSRELGISLANLARLACAMPAGGMDGSVLFSIMTVTDLGLALYEACS
jgi:hypothetical protein